MEVALKEESTAARLHGLLIVDALDIVSAKKLTCVSDGNLYIESIKVYLSYKLVQVHHGDGLSKTPRDSVTKD